MKKSLFVALILSTMAISACGGGGGAASSSQKREPVVFKDVKLTYGNPITGADGEYMRRLVSDFNKAYAGQISVAESYVEETEFYGALEMNMPLNLAPDIALVHSYKVASYANRNLLHEIQSALDVGQVSLPDNEFLNSTVQACYYKGKHYAIPLDIHTILLYYNKTLLDKYSLSVPTNREELLACCEWMDNNNANGWGLPLSVNWPSEFIYTTALYQNGGTDVNAETDYPAFNTKAGKEGLRLLNEIIWDYGYSPTKLNTDGDLSLFCQNKAMFHIQGDWMQKQIVDSAKALGFELGVTSLANMFCETPSETSKQVYARSHVFIVPENPTINNVKEQAILTFMRYIEDHADVWAQSGHTPASNVARSSEEYAKLPYHKYYGDINEYRLNTNSPYYYEGYSPVFQVVTSAMSNETYDATKLLNSAEKEGKDAVDTAKYNS